MLHLLVNGKKAMFMTMINKKQKPLFEVDEELPKEIKKLLATLHRKGTAMDRAKDLIDSLWIFKKNIKK